MVDALELHERPEAETIYMIAGWRQWADAGSTSSALPKYLIKRTHARKIGTIRPDGFYMFQIPGTHDLVRPVVKFEEGFPTEVETPRNEFFYADVGDRGIVFFLGDEPQLDIERYTAALLEAARELKVKRIIGLGGVYGEMPYTKERMVSCTYSQPEMKAEFERLAVTLSDYHGGASIGSHICRRAHEAGMEYTSFYAFVPTYDFSTLAQSGTPLRIENDYMAWLGIMRRINYMLKSTFDLSDLERKSTRLLRQVDEKIEEIDRNSPQLNVRDYFARLEEDFTETVFDPLDDVWEDELRRLLNDADDVSD